MKKIVLYLMIWMSMFVANGCVYERHRDVNVYPEHYREWPEERREQWRREHHQESEERRDEKQEERREERH